jgi:FtsP/CotA-like multicopper oxidase with cupredoxin domain
MGFAFGPGQSVVPGTGIRKFVDSLPGLGAANANDLGQYIPVAVPNRTAYTGCDYYEIELGQYTEQLHKDLPPTTLRGYRQTNTTDPKISRFSYLGPMIIAQKGRPVRVKFTNKLPTGTGGNLFIPVDTTVMGSGMAPDGTSYTQNRSVIHLHGGNTPWISDGTMHQWVTPAGETTNYPQGVSVQSVPDMPQPTVGDGTETFYYTNQQSARLMFYHDHAYGITRLNVYAGVAAGYILADDAEQALVNSKVIPADQIPLIIQDKTFVPNDKQLAAQDPTWDKSKYGGQGNLWFPHVYMPNQNPGNEEGANPMGRWDYGPWFWPPFTGLVNGPVPNPYQSNGPWEPAVIPGTPNPSIVPEAFMDTPLVNGTAYPFVKVGPKAYRFRILNASNDRTLNLQVYFAKSNGTMWNPETGTLQNGDAGEVNMVPATPGSGLPATWPTDGRDGGVPDPNASGPVMYQIGNEGGFLPQVAELPNTPVGYNYNRRDITVLNVSNKTLFLGPAERADVVIDFSKVPEGSKLILYNDAPAPVPAFDPRIDYYTGDPDQTATGGAPTTMPGYGPNTRTIMQFQVSGNVTGGMPKFNLNLLKSALPHTYAKYQAKPIVPQAAYNAAFNANYPVDPYARIQDTSKTFFSGPLSGITVTNGGSGYTSAPGVSITGGGGTGAVGTAEISGVTGVTISNGGNSYVNPPAVTFTGGGGTGAAAQAQISGVTNVGMTNNGTGYTTAPAVQFVGGGGTGAAGFATIDAAGTVTGVTVTNGGSGYTTAPDVLFVGGGAGTGAAATAVINLGAITGITMTDSGGGYGSAPSVGFDGGGGTGAIATAAIQIGAVTWVKLVNPGTGFSAAPSVRFSGGGGANAAATANPINMQFTSKSIIESFDPNYGRMNALLGVEVPLTNMNVQTSIPYFDTDPPSEVLNNSDAAAPIGTLADGTQIWKITHNGVDTHAIHWHMFNVQLLNRVGWDGMVKPPDANELGWKETVRMNPLEDVIVALRPINASVPFDVPNSNRLLDPTTLAGSTTSFFNVDPTGQPAPVVNHVINYGAEYVWHCHLLGHEENIMMRPMAVALAPRTPSALAGGGTAGNVVLSWTDNSKNEKVWQVERSTSSASGPWAIAGTQNTTTEGGTGATVNFTDTTAAAGTTYYYRVFAVNVVGDTTTYLPPASGYNNTSKSSAASNSATVITP